MSFVELVDAVAKRSGLSKRAARAALRAFLSETKLTLATGERVLLPGLGVFFVRESKPRALFGGTRKSGGKSIRFRASRRTK